MYRKHKTSSNIALKREERSGRGCPSPVTLRPAFLVITAFERAVVQQEQTHGEDIAWVSEGRDIPEWADVARANNSVGIGSRLQDHAKIVDG